jgi:Multimeric flavodoxin WrbA
MKVICINGSPKQRGNTRILLETICEELKQQGIATEILSLAGQNLKGCSDCRACMQLKNKQCVLPADVFNSFLAKMIEADGIILGSPVYSADVTSQMKALLDRASMVLAANKGLLKHKAGAAVVAARRGGGISAFDTLTHFLHSKEMFLVGSNYWNMVYGNLPGEVAADAEGMANMKNLGENMGWLLKRLNGSPEE